MLFGGRMDFQEFGNKLRRINKTLIHFEDVFYPSGKGNKRGILGKYTVLRPSYSKAYEYIKEIMEIREKPTEFDKDLEEFHKTLPNYSTRKKYTPKPRPFLVTICDSKFYDEIFFVTLEECGRDNFVAIFNKTIKEYIENKITLDKINKIERHKFDKYKQQIIKLDTWFNEFDFIPDNIKAFIDDNEKTDPLKSMPKQKEDTSRIKESKDTNDGMRNKFGYLYYVWNQLTKQKRVEILADMARKDTKIKPTDWRDKFRAEFPEGYSVELGRYTTKFEKQYRNQAFIINGLNFYQGRA